ncbi:hypothetical protein BH10ACT11_BH10ACT11_07570 [soil metagenome]
MKIRNHGSSRSRARTRLLAALTVAAFTFAAAQSSALVEREIVPGKSIGHAALGMSRKGIENKLKSPDKPKRNHFGNLYSLTYHYPYRAANPSDKLEIVFNGLGKHAKAGYMVTFERSLGTRPEDVGVHDKFNKMLGSYPNVNCYHSEPNGTRDENIEDTDNFECELRKHGGFTYFGFASYDSDPQEHIGAIAVSSIRVP